MMGRFSLGDLTRPWTASNGGEFIYGQRTSQIEETLREPQSTSAQPSQAYLQRAFLARNGQYSATWMAKDEGIMLDLNIDEYPDVAHMTAHAAAGKSLVLMRDITDYGFGLGQFSPAGSSLRAVVADYNRDWLVWRAERIDSDGKEMMVVTCTDTRNGATAVTAHVDPDKGFLTPSFEARLVDPNDNTVSRICEWSLEAKEVQPGVWFPVAVKVTDEWPGTETFEKVEYSENVIEIDANVTIPDETFTWENLRYPGERAFVLSPDSKAHVMKVVTGADPGYRENGDGHN